MMLKLLSDDNLDIDYNLLRKTYNVFFQFDNPSPDPNVGLYAILCRHLNIEDKSKGIKFYCKDYIIDKNIYFEQLYIDKGLSYVCKLYIKIGIIVNKKEYESTFSLNFIPIMINNSYFMINGTKKVMIYQLVKTGGIYYDIDEYGFMNIIRIVSSSGSRIELRINQREIINIYVNSSKKILLPEFFSLIDHDKIKRYIRYFKNDLSLSVFSKFEKSIVKHALIFVDLFYCRIISGKFYIYGDKNDLENYIISSLKNYKIDYNDDEKAVVVSAEDINGVFYFGDQHIKYKYKKTNILNILPGMLIDAKILKKIFSLSVTIEGKLLISLFKKSHELLRNCFLSFFDKNFEEVISEESPDSANTNVSSSTEDDTDEEEEEEKEGVSFDYDFSDDYDDNNSVGIEYHIDEFIRDRINNFLSISYSKESLRLTEEDIIALFIYFSENINKTTISKKSYDYLLYKRVKKAEDFIVNIILRRVNRLKNNIRYFSIDKTGKTNTEDFITSYSTSNEIRKIFTSHPLVQFLDQSNPLSELAHRRRISIFNLINTEKYQISFEGRDINPTYFGRICPIQTPEGSNIGLINSFAIYAQINNYGFITTPYYKVKDGKVSNEIVFISAEEEKDKVITSYDKGFEDKDVVYARINDDIETFDIQKVDYMDYSKRNILSISACLIPSIERNDARRSLMGANMQRQATPSCVVEVPVVGTGVEDIPVKMHHDTIYADRDCIVLYSCSQYVIVSSEDNEDSISVFRLSKFNKTNMKTCSHSVVRVKNGQRLKKGDIIADCAASDMGNLAIGHNLIVAFMSWWGYGFEDSIAISESLQKKSKFESICLNDIDIKAKELDHGREKITLDNPNESIRLLKNLDSRGIIKIGSSVEPFVVLASRVTPIETDSSFEDSVLSIIFGKKVSSFKDISVKAPCNLKGIVISSKYINRSKSSDDDFRDSYMSGYNDIFSKVIKSIFIKLKIKGCINNFEEYFNRFKDIKDIEIIFLELNVIIKELKNDVAEVIINTAIKVLNKMNNDFIRIYGLYKSYSIENNVTEYVKIVVAKRRAILVGDKIAGRHGNKGVVSCIVPEEDMPYLEDGTIIEMILNPLGIPNRLNIGQIMETYLGLTSYSLTSKVCYHLNVFDIDSAKNVISRFLKYKITRKDYDVDSAFEIVSKGKYLLINAPVFDSISFGEVKAILNEINSGDDGTYVIYDGKNGMRLNRKVHVGLKYFMKLNHMAEDKISARETGGYSTILQQPLARKINYGGQRAGEMEILALEGHGASAILLELAAPKSDDRESGNDMYSKIFDRQYAFSVFMPETINVILAYLQGASIVIELVVKKN